MINKVVFSILFHCLIFISIAHTSDHEIGFHKVIAKNGDGVIKLLDRYDLMGESCNVDKFYQLNKLERGRNLIKGKYYYLPVVLFTYNDQSIRTTIGINDWEKAERIASFNYELKRKGLRKSTYKASKILWVPFHELGCDGQHMNDKAAPMVKTASSKSAIINAPMFGAGYSKVKIRSKHLEGKVFYVVSGHGGPDPGAIADVSGSDLCEDEYAYDVSLRLARLLMEQGATVHMIIQDPNDGIRSDQYLDCDRDERCMGTEEIPLDQIARLRQRVFKINELHEKHLREGINDHTVICIHVDSRSPKKRQDVFFYYFNESKTGKKLANQLHHTFRDKYKKYRANGEYHGTVSDRSLYTLRFTNPPAVYVELANIKNPIDRRRLLPESNRQALANWLFEGLAGFH